MAEGRPFESLRRFLGRKDRNGETQRAAMVVGITSCGYHVPFCRLERGKIGQAWARRAGLGERAAIYFDEDALTLGRAGVIAEVLGMASRSDDFLDEWRRDSDGFIQTQSSRFTTERGYQANLVAVGQALLQKQGVQPQDCAKIILPSPDGRAHVN